MKSYYYFLALATYVVSFLICFNICLKVDIEKFICDKISRRVCLVIIAFLFSSVGSLVINGLNIAREYRSLIDCFFIAGPATALFVWAIPVKINRNHP
ncbi:hypothetical protein [Clostridium beijerinckii]|jgi:hypothetical protein|uniref:Uncharacterized protein n=2 Tax=Clostridium beijerinckii TaxID=1520 RepID=A0AB74VAY0_CLOBE|nr:hypothetical protein [Clostridium beijerinckii]MBC2458964.1 hypothetical protein [Clostridium beijerinckii]MBC2476500.1 hypothetical protein [Clostridium beijerinckii]MCI1581454.1 hypothetical protein [Clostridium beijerinckii]MCI1585727.1 hypothetical protein [Clostridium beijerinckii]MCI1624992.1 hypothetical protein [Clostridium beijerinckii]